MKQGLSKRILSAPLLLVLTIVTLGGIARADNLLQNPGFEDGVLAPWFNARTEFCFDTCIPWAVTSSDHHSGNFSAMDTGNIELRQNFAATPTSMIDQVSFWLRHPAGGSLPTAFDFFYSDGTDFEFLVFTSTSGWEFFNVTSSLSPGRSLVGFSIWGVTPNFVTFVDDLVINANTQVPEPGSLVLLGSGLLGVAGGMRRKLRAMLT